MFTFKLSESQCLKVLKHKHVSSLYCSVLKHSSLINKEIGTHSHCPGQLPGWFYSGEWKEKLCSGPCRGGQPPPAVSSPGSGRCSCIRSVAVSHLRMMRGPHLGPEQQWQLQRQAIRACLSPCLGCPCLGHCRTPSAGAPAQACTAGVFRGCSELDPFISIAAPSFLSIPYVAEFPDWTLVHVLLLLKPVQDLGSGPRSKGQGHTRHLEYRAQGSRAFSLNPVLQPGLVNGLSIFPQGPGLWWLYRGGAGR